MFLGQMECAGYTWTVVAETEERAKALLEEEYAKRVAAGEVGDVANGDPAEYFGINVQEVGLERVYWL